MNLKPVLLVAISLVLAACANKYSKSGGNAPVVDGYGTQARGIGERAEFQGELVRRTGQASDDMIVYFQFDSSNIDIFDNTSILSHVIADLRGNANSSIRLEGHTDQVGEGNYNEALSERRAQQVRDYMINHGVEPYRIEITSYGNSRPLMNCDPSLPRSEYIADDSCFALNRRVEIYLQ